MPWSFFFPSLDPSKWRLRELGLIKKMRSLKIGNLLNPQFWTLGAFKFGSGAAKFSVRPLAKIPTPDIAALSPDYLGERLAECLYGLDVQFEFLVQLQTDAKKMPIEDTTIEWISPFRRVATITIPAQDLRNPERSLLRSISRSRPGTHLRSIAHLVESIVSADRLTGRGRERANLRVRLTLSVIGWQLFSLIAQSRLSRQVNPAASIAILPRFLGNETSRF
jgi:hypothetical protein